MFFAKFSCSTAFMIITLVEGIQLEIHDGLRIPDAKRIYHIVAVANDGDIIGNGTEQTDSSPG